MTERYRGYTIQRDFSGTWHVTRDGVRICSGTLDQCKAGIDAIEGPR